MSECLCLHRHRVHHRAGDHPGGSFICCPNCYRAGFQSPEALEAHTVVCRTILCIKEECHNYGREAPFTDPCRHSKRPSQRSIWRIWYRRARGLGPNAPVPETGGGTPSGTPISRNRSQRSHAHTPVLLLRTPSSHNGSSIRPPRSAPPASGYAQSPMPAAVQTVSQLSSNSLLQDLAPPAPMSLTYLAQSLETIARALLTSVISPRPQLSRINDGWSAAALSGPPPQANGVTDYNLVYRIQMLRTLVSEYRNLAMNQAERTQTAWADLRPITFDLLRVQLAGQPPAGWLSMTPTTVDVTHLYAHAEELPHQVSALPHAGASAVTLQRPTSSSQTQTVPFNWEAELQSISSMVDGNRPPSYTQTQAYYGQGLDPAHLQAQPFRPFVPIAAEARSNVSGPSFSGYYSENGSFDFGDEMDKE